MENNEILMEEEESILTLTDENGVDMEFEYLDCIQYQPKEYLILMPLDEENENYVAVEDEAILDAVYAIFKERYKDILNFAD